MFQLVWDGRLENTFVCMLLHFFTDSLHDLNPHHQGSKVTFLSALHLIASGRQQLATSPLKYDVLRQQFSRFILESTVILFFTWRFKQSSYLSLTYWLCCQMPLQHITHLIFISVNLNGQFLELKSVVCKSFDNISIVIKEILVFIVDVVYRRMSLMCHLFDCIW